MENNIPKLRFPEFTGEWEIKKLGEISDNIMYGMNSAAIDFDGENKYLRITDIDESSRQFMPKPLVSPDGEIEEKYKLKYGDIVFTRTGASVGKTYLYNPKDGNLLFAGFLIKFSIKNGNPYFIYAQTLKESYNKWVLKMSMRSGQPGLNAEECKEFEISFPTLPEQTKIANFLTAVDDKLTQLKRKKSLLEQYKKGVMQRIFSAAETHGRASIRFKDDNGVDFAEWEEKKLGEVGKFFSGGTPLTTKREFFNGEIPFIRSGEINSERTEQFITELGLKNSSAKIVEIGDLIYALYGATSGEVAISKIKGAINQAILCIRTEQVNKFLYYYLWLNKEIIIKTYLQGGQGNLSADIIKSISVPIPSIREQTKIANFLSAIDEKISHCGLQIEKMEGWKKGLLQGMFV